jgi:hypothetical protein
MAKAEHGQICEGKQGRKWAQLRVTYIHYWWRADIIRRPDTLRAKALLDG